MSSLRRDNHKAQLQTKYPQYQFRYVGGTRGRAKYAGGDLIACVTPSTDTEAERDRKTLELLRGKLVVPEVVEVFDAGVERYFVYRLIQGESAGVLLKHADDTQSYEIGKLMGATLKDLQSLKVQAFGDLKVLKDWSDLLEEHVTEISEDEFPQEPEKPVLVHNDFVPHNLLLDTTATKVVGVIDFEWAFIGDRMWDVGYLKYWLNSNYKDFKDYGFPLKVWEGFLDGYGEKIDCKAASFYAEVRKTNGVPPPPISWGD